MSISTTATKDSYAGNNSIVTQYPITFKYFEESHISVYFDGVLQTKGAGADYVMGGDGTTSTGYITTNVAQAGTVTVAITLDVPFDQPVVLQETGSLPAKTIEVEGFDRLNMQVRRVWRKLQDVLTFNTDEAGASTGTADNLIGFDGSGDIAEIPNTTFLQQDNNLSELANAPDQAAAQTNLNVDPAGTDNSTDVTKTGAGTYISLAGQVLTVDEIAEGDLNASINASLDKADTSVQVANNLSDVDAATARTNLNVDVAGTRFPLSELTDSTISTPTSGQLLSWNGSAWINTSTDADGGMLAGVYDPNTVGGDTFAMDNMVEGANTKILTSAERTAIASVATLDGADISYTPAGTGSSVTTVQAKLREMVSVKDYGAVGDDSTDDTVAINLAIADMNNGEFNMLYFPAGTYVISSTLTTITGSHLSFVADGIQACTLRYKSNAGTNGTFFVIGDATTRCSQLLIQGIQFTCSNSLTLDGVGNALIFNNSIQCAISGCETSGVNGLVQVGSTALGTITNGLTISNTGGVCEASAGGKCLDLQSWSNLKLDHCSFSASGVAASSFRGLYAHPQVGDTADALKAVNCEWNYPNNDPDVVIEYDFSQNTTGNQQFTNCVFDQAAGLGSRNIYVHIDSGKTVDAKGRLMFNNCTSNASTDATCIEIDNTGDGALSLEWVGGQLTYTGTDGRCAYITGGNNVNTRFSSVFFQSRAATQPDVAIEVDDGCSGVTVIGCSFGLGNYNSVHFDYPFRFNGQITDLILTGNNASGSVSGLLVDWVAQPTTLFETRVIRDNITPYNRMPYRTEVPINTTLTAATITLEDEAAYKITAKVLGKLNNTTNFCMYEVVGLFYRDAGGVATLSGSLVIPISVESNASLDATLSVSGNDVILELTSLTPAAVLYDFDLEINENIA